RLPAQYARGDRGRPVFTACTGAGDRRHAVGVERIERANPAGRFHPGERPRTSRPQEGSLGRLWTASPAADNSDAPRPALIGANATRRVVCRVSGTIARCTGGRGRAPPHSMTALQISPGQLSLAALRSIWADPLPVAVEREARTRVDAAAETIARVVAEGHIVYGVNT